MDYYEQEEPDWDDLIQEDIMNEPHEEEEDYYEIPEDEEGGEGMQGANVNTSTAAVVQQKENNTAASSLSSTPPALSTPQEDDQDEDEQKEEEEEGCRRQQHSSYNSINNTTNDSDLFSFERYNKGMTWRHELVTSPDTMKAKQFAKNKTSASSLFQSQPQQKQKHKQAQQRPLLAYTIQTNTPRVVLCPKRMTLRPIPGTSVSITLQDGQRLYMKQNSSSETGSSSSSRATTHESYPLGESMRAIRARVDRRRRQAVTLPTNENNRAQTITNSNNNSKQEDQLWVDKHAPTSWSHLLSEERVNRQVLKALKVWDPYVFGRPAPVNNNPNNHNQSNQLSTTSNTSNDSRPPVQQRVILLSGPPGTGKTTLAHWVAQHTGYRPLEINGSEDRSATLLMQHISRAMESSTLDHHLTSSTTGQHRPNCIILDEIDGADAKGAIQAIVELIQATNKQKTYLRRPILFLCNHKYAPALRPLLPFAKQFEVLPPEPQRLVQRLRGILSQEQCVVPQPNLLHDLVTETAGDIRSCLFTLQWAKAAALRTSTNTVDLSRALEQALQGSGLKDERNDVASCLTTVFRREKRHKEGSNSSLDQVLHSVDRFGDSSKVLDSLFINASQVSFVDPTLDRCATIYEWLSASDLFRSSFALEAWHTPMGAGAAHVLGRVERTPNFVFSTRFFSDMRYQRDGNVALLQRFAEGLPQCQLVSVSRAVTETIPYSMAIVAPLVTMHIRRTVTSVELLTPIERVTFEQAVQIMIGLGLSYIAADDFSHSSFGGPPGKTLRLDPPMDRLTSFEGSASLQSQIPLPMKELLTKAIAVRRIQSHITSDENEAAAVEQHAVQETSELVERSPAKRTDGSEPVISGQSPAADASNFLRLGARQAKAARSARSALRAGIDRSSKRQKTSHSGSGVPLTQVVRLKYVKGFTQAVRTPCYPEDL